MPGIHELSEREREILCLVAKGASNKQIAHDLTISTNTVKVHLRNIFAKIEVASRTEAAMYAVRAGLVETAAPQAGEGRADQGEEHALSRPASPGGEKELQAARLRWRIIAAGLAILAVSMVALLAVRAAQAPAPVLASPDAPAIQPRWQENAPMLTARLGLAAVPYENQVYAIGGETGEAVTAVLERYDPATDGWSDLSPKKVAVAEVGAAVVGGEIYVPGGRDQSGQLTAVLEVYDPEEDRWETRAPLPKPLSAYALAAFEGRLFVFGGWDGENFVDSVYEYDPASDSWSERTPMPTARGYAAAAVAGGKIYVMGGYDGEEALNANEVYLPERDHGENNPWGVASPLPQGRYGMGITSLADIVHIVGGIGAEGVKLAPLEYFPQPDEWRQFENPVPQAWSHLGLVALETRLYAFGGSIDGVPSTKSMSYQAIYTISIPLVR